MASTAKTQDFFIGDLDLRVSTDLTKAGELAPTDAIGLMTDCTVSMTTNEVKLDAGFPQRTYATAVSSRDLTITGSLSEYTVGNLAMLYGDKTAYEASLTATAGTTLPQHSTTKPMVKNLCSVESFAHHSQPYNFLSPPPTKECSLLKRQFYD